MNHAFVSSSTREGSQFHDALRNFGGPEHERLLAEAAKHSGHTVHPAVGYWEDGAEESAHIKGPNADLVGEKLGRQFGQKSVLLFSETPHGPDRMWHFKTRATGQLRKHLSPFLTVTADGTRIVEQEASPEFHDKAKALGGEFTQGKAVFRKTNDD